MNKEFYIWPIAQLAVAQVALNALNSNPRLPLTGRNAKTGILEPNKQKTTKWTDSVQEFVNDTCGFPRMPETLMNYLGVTQEERDAWLTAFNPSIVVFDPAWLPPSTEE